MGDLATDTVTEAMAATRIATTGTVELQHGDNNGTVTLKSVARSNMVNLTSVDGQKFQVTPSEAAMFQAIRNSIEDKNGSEETVVLSKVQGSTLEKIIEYVRHHTEEGAACRTGLDIEKWDAAYAKVDQSTLYFLLTAASSLGVKGLLDLMCSTVANIIKDYEPNRMRKTFGIKNDFTAEEEAAIREQNAWAFQK